MPAKTPSETAKILSQYSGGDLGWRETCKELGLWSYDDLFCLLQEHGLTPPMPKRDDATRDVIARLGLESE